MNRERAKELLPVIQAFAEGKEVEFKDKNSLNEGWCGELYQIGLEFNDDNIYRVKPSPQYRPWTGETFPLDCLWLKHKSNGQKYRPTCIADDMVSMVYIDALSKSPALSVHTYAVLSEDYIAYIGSKQSWLPCGVKISDNK